ncbi:MAG: class IV adenylate cyclase [Salinirussus sp.]
MYEVEIKQRASHETVRPRLSEMDAEPLGAVEQVDTYYDAPHRDFAETDEALRVRRERTREQSAGTDPGGDGTTTRVTYKGPLVDVASKTREEFETGIDDGDTFGSILDALGFVPAATVEKERERYAVGEYTVTLDAVASLGEFVEVETESRADGIETAREGVQSLLAELGLESGPGIRTSYLELVIDETGDG